MTTETPKRPVAEFFEKVWGQALLTVSTAEDEVQKLVSKVAEGWHPDEVKKQVQQLTERLSSQRQQAEKSVEEAVKRTLSKLKLPRREELAQLNARLDAITKRLEALSK